MEKNMESERRKKFVKVAENRTNKIIAMVRLLGNCSNKSAYEYTEKDIELIFSTLENELKEAKKRFQSMGVKNESHFKL